MLTILDTLNHFLGYFNINNKPRNQIYTVIASIGNFYLLYLALHAFRYQYYPRAILYLLVFLILLYFCILNIVFYFTQKTMKFDISPKIEKLLGGPPKDALAAQKAQAQAQPAPTTQIKNVPTAGLFNENSLVPATIDISSQEQDNLRSVVQELEHQALLSHGFDQLSDVEISQKLQKNQPVAKITEPTALPFFNLQIQDQDVIILAGLNALTAKPVGHLAHVGLSSIDEAMANYKLALADLKVIGGPQKVLNQGAISEVPTPYKLQAKVAFQQKQAPKAP
ncbi:MAG: hypothetical protein LKF36_01250 [Lactobacillus sp.]|jgi:hypothetical protein|nr:hypothetical protein [Lactobacillus sp.]